MTDDRAKSFLQMIRRARRGRLKIYLGYGPGVGKTYFMLTEAHRMKKEGVDIVVALVETHGRAETAQLVEGLEVIPRRRYDYKGIQIEEMDIDAVLARNPQVALVDELAHTNVPGSRNQKRYEDVRELLAAGIHVMATLNVQHLESLYNTVENLIGVKVRERIPDAVVAEADHIINVDLTPEDLQRRLREGKIYPMERIGPSLENFFKQGNLEHLRELTMREIAAQIDFKRREGIEEGDRTAPDQIMVCLASKGPNATRMLRFTSRLAGRLNRNWYAIYVQTPKEDPTVIDAMTQRLLADTLTVANQLGATVFTFKGEDVVDTILRFAKEYRVGHIVIGRPRRIPEWKRRLLGKRSIAEELVIRAEGFAVVVVDSDGQGSPLTTPDVTSEEVVHHRTEPRAESSTMHIRDVLHPSRIIIAREPMTKEQVMLRLVEVIASDNGNIDPNRALELLRRREEQGSTFLNEIVAIPHARLDGLTKPEVALAVTRGGISDVQSHPPLEFVFLLLAPGGKVPSDLSLLTSAIRLFQNSDLRRKITGLSSTTDILRSIRETERR